MGSSNLSNAALTSGLEWNTKITKKDLPETIDKIAATFEFYWNDREFEYYDEGQQERLARALKAEKYQGTKQSEIYTLDVQPYAFQQEILDRLEAERTVRGYTRKGNGLYYSGIWQELILEESEGLLEWAESVIR